MKTARLLLILASLSLLLTACGANGLYQVTLITDGEHQLTGAYPGDLLMLGGKATLLPDFTLQGSLHLVSGQLDLHGQVFGDVTLLGGKLTLGPSACLGGNLNLGGGTFHPSPGSVIEGHTHTGSGIPLPDLPEQNATPPGGTLLNALLFGLAAAFLTRYFPRSIARVGEAASRHALVSGSVGLLVAVVGISLLVTMAYTILLIPISLLGLFALGLAAVFGWIGLGATAGNLIGRVLNRPLSPAKSAFIGTLAFVLVLELITSLPLVGDLLGIIVAAIGLGAVSLTRFGFQTFIPATE
ncbi:MAG: hypothetical protein HXY39_18065 [Chloroflexi bacterium]|nr:hypothetical protein [Chloroflexota bacterium]